MRHQRGRSASFRIVPRRNEGNVRIGPSPPPPFFHHDARCHFSLTLINIFVCSSAFSRSDEVYLLRKRKRNRRDDPTAALPLMRVSPNKDPRHGLVRQSNSCFAHDRARAHPIKRSDAALPGKSRSGFRGTKKFSAGRGTCPLSVDGETKERQFSRKMASASCNFCTEKIAPLDSWN